MAGETLKKFARGENGECCIGSSIDEAAGTVLVISFVSLVVIISVLATFLFARNCRLLQRGVHSQPTSMKMRAVEVLPCYTFKTAYFNSKRNAETCAICLEDYQDGEMIRVLPCKHGHQTCCTSTKETLFTSCQGLLDDPDGLAALCIMKEIKLLEKF